MTIHSNEAAQSFNKVCDMYKMKKEDCTLIYPLRLSSGQIKEMIITYNDFFEEQCKSFFKTCEELSSLITKKVEKIKDLRNGYIKNLFIEEIIFIYWLAKSAKTS